MRLADLQPLDAFVLSYSLPKGDLAKRLLIDLRQARENLPDASPLKNCSLDLLGVDDCMNGSIMLHLYGIGPDKEANYVLEEGRNEVEIDAAYDFRDAMATYYGLSQEGSMSFRSVDVMLQYMTKDADFHDALPRASRRPDDYVFYAADLLHSTQYDAVFSMSNMKFNPS